MDEECQQADPPASTANSSSGIGQSQKEDSPKANIIMDIIETDRGTGNNIQDQTETQEIELKQSSLPRKAGYARIKSEFLLLDHKPKIQTEYLSEASKRKIAAVDGEKQTEEEDDSSEPPNKKPKLKGRNKQRPRNERIEQKDKLCPSIKSGNDCKFGDSCKFNHDVKDFLSKKRPDIPEKCPVFTRLGFCKFGVTCRFASSHLDDNQENIVNHDLYDVMKEKSLFLNTLSDDVRRKLWKRKYNFSKAMKSVNTVQKLFKTVNNASTTKICDKPKEGNGADATNETKDVLSLEEATIGNDLIKEEATVDNDLVLEEATVDNDLIKGEATVDKEIIKEETTVDKEIIKEEVAADKDLDTDPLEPAFKTNLPEGVLNKTTVTNIDDVEVRLTPREVKKINFRDKLYLAPLTTVGNLPFRRVCKDYGVDVTCSEMALASQLLKAKASEWSLIKRHPCEDLFGVQVCGAYPDMMTKCAQVLTETSDIDFIDINCGCPIDLVFKKGSGSALMGKVTKLEQICRSMRGVMGEIPLTVKLRTGVFDNKSTAHTIIPRLRDAGVSLVTIHGRSREQRYTKLADWDYIDHCASLGGSMPVFGNGDILSYEDANLQMARSGVSGVMIARGALIKPWIFTEIKEQRHWDISSSERLDILRSYTNYGLEHWGSDHQGVENTRRFLLEWLSFLHRYIPVGVLEQVPQKINERPPYYIGRNDLETMMASANCADWIKISEMLLGPVPPSFQFLPKHKANAYQ